MPPHRTNEDRSEALAEQIRRFWKERGYTVDVCVVPVDGPLRIAEIVSDTVNGLPRGYIGPLHDLAIVKTPPDPPSRSRTRPCITCCKLFTSDGPGNRMCVDCRWKAGGGRRDEGRER